ASLSYRIVASVALFAICAGAVTSSTPQLPDPGNPGMSRPDQEKLGLKAMAEVYKEMPVLPDSSPVTQYVQRLGAKLVKQIPQEYSWQYQFHVVQQKDINAFALPGGPIFINVGTIDAAQNEAQLAGVMSHEMSHVYMQHSAKQIKQNTLPNILAGIGQIAGKVFGGIGGAVSSIGGQMIGGMLSMKYSRGDEAQADAVGAIIMYKAGYNPIELANFFEALEKQGGGPPQFLSDHPNPGNRTAAIQREIRNWPPKNYASDSASFQGVKKQASGVPAYSGQEIADGAKQGRWARQNMDSGAVPESARQTVSASASSGAISNVSLDQIKPSSEFTETRQDGFSIAYPYNWGTASGQNSLTIAPKAAVGHNAIAYGVIISQAQDQNGGSLDQVTQDLVQNLQQSNPGMRQNGTMRTVSVSGTAARELDLSSTSPLQQTGNPLPERDRLVVVPASEGSYIYLIFIAPERDFGALEPTFEKMLTTLRVE
ncbi:MAG TPA: M48 family metallopeptidase, partial [Terriglobales bacterium]|nr:M48 family metallopeptidase [Terriglobales bacterium]